MKTVCFGVFALLTTLNVAAAVHYVDLASPSPLAPYASWETAATNIQDAVDAAVDGDTVLVTNGVYAAGGRLVSGSLTNRVAVTNAIRLESVNGPEVTAIEGYQVPGTTNGASAVRCMYLAQGASLIGFTLRNGATRDDGGNGSPAVLCGGGVYAESKGATVSNCFMVGNSARVNGGGAYSGTLFNCYVVTNTAVTSGGGTGLATLTNCFIAGNSSSQGAGGVRSGTLDNCQLVGNRGLTGGAAFATLRGCLLVGNIGSTLGGGAWSGALFNCTLIANSATSGGGAFNATLTNCLVYYNDARTGANYTNCVMGYCCTFPLPTSGPGNISSEPRLADSFHIGSNSPCRGAGLAAATSGFDIDGQVWSDPPAIGCDEYRPGGITGDLSAAISATHTHVATGYLLELVAEIGGHADMHVWDFGDGTLVTNMTHASHAWSSAGDYAVSLRVYNDSNPSGVGATLGVRVLDNPIHYVALASLNPVEPYLSWETAATNIQDAVDAAAPGGSVLVSNGIYSVGGRVLVGGGTNRVLVSRPLKVQSLNGPAETVIEGYQVGGTNTGAGAVRCVYLANNALLSGFTLRHGATPRGAYDISSCGGGVACESPSAVVSNCTILQNIAWFAGGGAYAGTLYNCSMISNITQSSGGGGGVAGSVLYNCRLSGNNAPMSAAANQSTLYNCTLVGNLGTAGVAFRSSLTNCISYFNSGKNHENSTLDHCCTTPLPATGTGNFTNEPGLIDYAGGDLRLQPNSPCINAGANLYVGTGTDLDGNPRISGGTVDVGAYEFQSPASSISYAWLQGWGLPCDGSADTQDCDGDGMNAWQEWIADTGPTNSASLLQLLTPTGNSPATTVIWTSSTNRSYFVERATSFAPEPIFAPLGSNIRGRETVTSFVDTNAPLPGPVLYRVGVQLP